MLLKTTHLPTLLSIAIGLLPVSATCAVGDDTDFEPIVEAKLPEGFPQYTPVGDIQIKRYPAYRKAQTSQNTGRAFWTLFSHIKQNEIAMTAPVEMGYAEGQRPRERSMAFLYGSPELGQPGLDNRVEVIDVPPTTVVSIGVRGPRTEEAVAAARDRLKAWLEKNENLYAANGELRVMAYNSPFVPRNRNFFEVEVPIRPLDSHRPSQ